MTGYLTKSCERKRAEVDCAFKPIGFDGFKIFLILAFYPFNHPEDATVDDPLILPDINVRHPILRVAMSEAQRNVIPTPDPAVCETVWCDVLIRRDVRRGAPVVYAHLDVRGSVPAHVSLAAKDDGGEDSHYVQQEFIIYI